MGKLAHGRQGTKDRKSKEMLTSCLEMKLSKAMTTKAPWDPGILN